MGREVVMKLSTYEELQTSKYKDAFRFVNQLLIRGVPLPAINRNDWDNVPAPKVYVTIPYGNGKGGEYRAYKRFSDYDLDCAVNFWSKNFN